MSIIDKFIFDAKQRLINAIDDNDFQRAQYELDVIKFAKEPLVNRGKSSLTNCISSASVIMPSSIKRPSDYKEEVYQLLDHDFQNKGAKLPWENVFIDGGFIIFKVKEDVDYDVHLSQVNSIEKVKKWKEHLSEKRWFTDQMLEEFKRLIANEFNLDLGGV